MASSKQEGVRDPKTLPQDFVNILKRYTQAWHLTSSVKRLGADTVKIDYSGIGSELDPRSGKKTYKTPLKYEETVKLPVGVTIEKLVIDSMQFFVISDLRGEFAGYHSGRIFVSLDTYDEGVEPYFNFVAMSRTKDGVASAVTSSFHDFQGFIDNELMSRTYHAECAKSGVNRYGEREISSDRNETSLFIKRNDFTGEVSVRAGVGWGGYVDEINVVNKNGLFYITKKNKITDEKTIYRIDFLDAQTKYQAVLVKRVGE